MKMPTKTKQNKGNNRVFVIESGKRKRAIARAVVKPGKGEIRINNYLLSTITNEYIRAKIEEPLHLIPKDILSKINIKIKVRGGGINGQAEAARLAMCRAIIKYSKDEKLKSYLEAYDRSFIIADVRRKEKYKPNDSKARAKRQKSYR